MTDNIEAENRKNEKILESLIAQERAMGMPEILINDPDISRKYLSKELSLAEIWDIQTERDIIASSGRR